MAIQHFELLGRKLDDPSITEFVASYSARSERTTVEDKQYLTCSNAGFAIAASLDGTITSVFLYSEGYEGNRAFIGNLPHGLTLGDSRLAVRKKLGVPTKSADVREDAFSGTLPAFDRYNFDRYWLHIQYVDSERSVGLVTLMVPRTTKRS